VLRFATAEHAAAVGSYAMADLSGRPWYATGTFAWSPAGSRWIEIDFGGIPRLVRVLTRGVYMAFIIASAAGDEAARSLLFTLAQQQYDLLADQ
jgi:hypothetical protein